MKLPPLLSAGLTFLLISVCAGNPVPRMVKDINTEPDTRGSTPVSLVTAGSRVFFLASTRSYGSELWSSDGTTAGTVLAKDIWSGASSGVGASHTPIVSVGGVVYFFGQDAVSGRELWRSDGTAAGTFLVKEIAPGALGIHPEEPPSAFIPPAPSMITRGGEVYFVASNGTAGEELWKSNGTAAGTLMVKELGTGSASGLHRTTPMTALGSWVLFIASTSAAGAELWRTDGTAAGTVMVKDIYAGPQSSLDLDLVIWKLTKFFVHNGIAYFPAADATSPSGRELWRSDGTAAGTYRVKAGVLNPANFVSHGGQLYFTASSAGDGVELWRTNGTAAGTVVAANVNPSAGSDPASLFSTGTQLFFYADDGFWGRELCVLDTAAPAGFRSLREFLGEDASLDGVPLAALGGDMLMSATSDGRAGLWKTDGTIPGTSYLNTAELRLEAVTAGGIMFFAANDRRYGFEFWKTDGTAAGTVMVRDISADTSNSSPDSMITSGGRTYFYASGGTGNNEVWTTDGTDAGTLPVTDLNLSSTATLQPYGSGFLLNAAAGSNAAARLWMSDDTGAAPALLYTAPSDAIRSPVTSGSRIYWYRNSQSGAAYAKDLWTSTGSGAQLLRSIPRVSTDTTNALGIAGGQVHFFVQEPTGGAQWRSDGTEAGTVRVATHPASGLLFGTVWNNGIYFTHQDAEYNTVWLRSDGTAAGPVQLASLYAGSLSGTSWHPAGDRLFLIFSSHFGASGGWMTDGTPAGSSNLSDLWPGTGITWYREFAAAGSRILFAATTPSAGHELWSSDTTPGGTALLRDILPGTASSSPSHFITAGGRVYFLANTTAGVRQLWTSDGTPSGTAMLGPANFTPNAILNAAGRRLYLAGTTNEHGMELWSAPLRLPPLGTLSLQSFGETTAAFLAQVDPGGQAATAIIRYGTGSAYDKSHPLVLRADCEPETLVPVLTGLPPGTTGNARLVLTNSVGTQTGPAVAFTSLPVGYAAWMQTHFATSAATGPAALEANPDGDSGSNLLEFLAGTDPLAAASAFQVTVAPSATALHFGPVSPGRQYIVEQSTALSGWVAQPALTYDTNATQVTVPLLSVEAQLFLRVRLQHIP